ncbi:MAG: hypothetical protein K0S23_707 [Fluviicola sp.]|jgi:hypothetical protein|uniref:hypothetical protein n=1 Tax=Fluviicola sp. TaxID=1917219 RepID=UPI0026255541|nr:hypothetical protein [Fluviicola sp.]MDF3026400.1 hypothetical protein [Fluviicola sp.]
MNYTALILASLIPAISFTQSLNFNSQRNWAMNKHEISIGLGVTSFLGDLGGSDRIGSDYSLRDIDFNSTLTGGSFSYRYRFHPFFATSTMVNAGMLSGSDALTAERVRNMRNLSFRSFFGMVSQRFEIIVLANERIGGSYNIPGLRRFTDHNEQLYLIAGIGAMYYNPKALYDGEWVTLRDMHTEGQGLPGGPAEYKRITATVPLGIGFRMGINRLWRFGLEATYVKTFSDYIDDVHGEYYDPAVIEANYGPQAAYLSNPSTTPEAFNPGSRRGGKQNDAFLYLNIMITRNITYKSSSGR